VVLVGRAVGVGSLSMKEPKFTDQQISFILKQADNTASIEETCRKAGISVHTYLRLRAKYAGLTPAEITRLHQLEDETKRLKRLLATLILERQAHQTGIPLYTPGSSRNLPVPAPEPIVKDSKLSTLALLLAHGFASRARRLWQLLRDDLPTRARERLARALPALNDARRWVWSRVKALRWRRIGDLAVKPWMATGRSMGFRGRRILLACFAVGLAGGFAYGLREAPVADLGPPPVPVDLSVRANSYGSVSSTLGNGWGRPQSWGTWMIADKGSIMLGFDGPSLGDVELLIEARVRPGHDGSEQTMTVRFNDAELGRWQLPKRPTLLRRRFIVPRAVFNRSTAARVDFELPGDPTVAANFGLQALSLRDARLLRNFRGFVDSCSPNKLAGWAVAEGSAVSIAASVDGEPLKATLTNVERLDLAKHGLPADAGYELVLDEPVAPGSEIDVRFANGRPLTGSPCRP
jgi:putative transposase